MASTATNPPPIRACLFDMDGLLLDTEDLYTKCINVVLARYSRPNLPWSIKAKLQGRPAAEATSIFHSWADLPISNEQYLAEFSAQQREHFPTAAPLPGVEKLLADLRRARDGQDGSTAAPRVHLALATSSTQVNFRLKSAHLAELFSVFRPEHRVLGDDPRIPRGRGKPLPDIYLVALAALNASLPAGEAEIRPEECLVFEDSVPGVEAGRRAGMQVVWVPHPMLKKEYEGREDEILAGRMGEAGDVADGGKVGEIGDGWGLYLETLENFPYDKFGIQIPS
ncbi:hypothetical protein MGG_11115 [Pyricularia oryzae 70-15]|uniref:GS1-like protein n=3 Tax=Pyricularia oryzae TaxID=318829 RepID=G4MWP3_PYRO7|nr:uncharacterized protein MGG_11115 [Pyricularia oryzae 70-15]EHA55098.1 hypothetical protein MGG_11115 [Pyricularia oryzae 70-15]KAI7915741.1 hypothetical protein M0657_008922 [Pyricularia oryzae]KAI7924067.1 hypothetical protein M9X92_004028 [Pyricularia oryzae]